MMNMVPSMSPSLQIPSPLARYHGPETPDELYGASFNSSVVTRSYRTIDTSEVGQPRRTRESRSDGPRTCPARTRTASRRQREIDEPETVVDWSDFVELPLTPPVEAAEEGTGRAQRDGDGSRGNEIEELVALKERVAQLEITAAETERKADIQAEKKKVRLRSAPT